MEAAVHGGFVPEQGGGAGAREGIGEAAEDGVGGAACASAAGAGALSWAASGAEACVSAGEGCTVSGASRTADPPLCESCSGVMVSRVESGLRLSSYKVIASLPCTRVRDECGTVCSGLLAWSLGCVEAALADDPSTIPAAGTSNRTRVQWGLFDYSNRFGTVSNVIPDMSGI